MVASGGTAFHIFCARRNNIYRTPVRLRFSLIQNNKNTGLNTMCLNELNTITDDLIAELNTLAFTPPVSHVYNPLEYAREPYRLYLKRFATPPKEAVFIGMNPGPWGMAQTGIPFGEVNAVRDWLKIEAAVGSPKHIHPKRPVTGFSCHRSEISGKRLWGWAQKKFNRPDRFFARFLVLNYCPLLFIEASGRNKTPNSLRIVERAKVIDICDRALRRTIQVISPEYVIGIGAFAEQRAARALAGLGIPIGRITHPSPANPKANRGWETLIDTELSRLGIYL